MSAAMSLGGSDADYDDMTTVLLVPHREKGQINLAVVRQTKRGARTKVRSTQNGFDGHAWTPVAMLLLA